MDGVATPIIGRPRPLPGHDTPNPAYHPHTLNYEEPVMISVSLRAHNAPTAAHPWTSPDLVTQGPADPHALRQRSHQSAPYIPHCSMNTRVLESLLVAIADEP